MMWTRSIRLALLFGYLLLLPPRTEAAGELSAVGRDGAPLGGCPLEHTAIEASVTGFVARVVVTQRFVSPFSEPVEALYTFPLSERAAVDAMTMRLGDRVVRGEIRTREEARRVYDEAKRQGRLASRLDEERANVFTQSVANLMPGATVEIRIEYVEPLRFEAGTFEVVFPTVVGPRFTPAGTPDAAAVTPPVVPEGRRSGHDIAISVEVAAGVPIRSLRSPLHAIDVERPSRESARVRLRREAEIPNRDFVLRWEVSGDELESAVLSHRSDAGDGYLSLVLLPPARVEAARAAPKEMVFVVDRSGSQMGAPLEKAKETMRWVLEHMNPDDTFQVIDFGSSSNALFSTPQPASAAMKREARAYIDALQANGGTMMVEAIERVCAMPADEHRLRIVVFMTDGYVGNDVEVLGLVKRLRGTSRWFPFGTGNSVNRFLIEGMARLGGGEPEIVLLGDSGPEVARRFHERISSPVLTDVAVSFEDLDVVDVFPDRHADLWAERPLVIHARYRSPGRGRAVLTGFLGGEPYRHELAVELPARADAHAAIASMWARAKVEDLMSEDLTGMHSGEFAAPLREQIVRVALAHRLLTPFTSFVAVEERVVNQGGESRTVRVPVEMPDGVRYEGIFGAGAPADAAAGGPAFARQALAAPAAPVGSRVLAERLPEGQGALADRDLRASEDEAASSLGPTDAPKLRTLDPHERRVLGEPLRRLLEEGPGAEGAAAVVDGWVRVRIELRDASAGTRRVLGPAGFKLESQSGRSAVGIVRVADLRRLARIPAVVRIRAEPARA